MCHMGYPLIPWASEKPSLLSCISASGDPQHSELGLKLHVRDVYSQTQDSDYKIIIAYSLTTVIISLAHPLYLLSKKILWVNEHTRYDEHLDTLSFQCKPKDSVHLETCCGPWNILMLVGKFSFILLVASNTVPTAVNLQCWHIQCDVKCPICGCIRPTMACVLRGFPVTLS